jgi:hypothetical protein
MSSSQTAVLRLSLAVVTLACAPGAWSQEAGADRVCSPVDPVSSVPTAARESLPLLPRGREATIHDRWAEAAREIPGGFAGEILEGGVVIFLVDTTKRDTALAALAARGALLGRDPKHVRVRKARWDFAQLHDWYAYLNLHGFQRDPGLTSSGLDEAHNQVTYGVRDDETHKRYERRLVELGIPCGLVNIEIVGRYHPE